MKKHLLCFLVFCLLCISLVIAQDFNPRAGVGLIGHDPINEASGLAASRKNPSILWIHNDSGANEIYAMDSFGNHLGVYTLDGITIRDLEDIAIGPGPNPLEQYIYLGDIGDNAGVYTDKYVYRFIEPDVLGPGDDTITGIETITVQYPAPNNYDSETLMVDPLTKDIFLVTKSMYPAAGPVESDLVFRASYPQSTSSINTMTQVATLTIPQFLNPLDGNFYGATGGDISVYGLEILIRTYDAVYHWEKQPGDDLWDAFLNPYFVCPYDMNDVPIEAMGEAICWDSGALGYFTTGEEPNSPIPPFEPIPAYLSYTSRNDDPPLPIVLSSFTAIQTEANFAQISWTTQSETNLYGYNVYRSDEIDFNISFKLNTSILEAENTPTGSDYSYTDESVEFDQTYFYWLESVDLSGNTEFFGPISITLKDNNQSPDLPNETLLQAAYPNPFNPKTTVNFSVKKDETAQLMIYNMKGQIVKSYPIFEAGNNSIEWLGKDNFGKNVSSGVFFYRLKSASTTQIRKMIMMK
ncbi:MAG: T9SS type A sorting domain-containing protein [Candidatus Cloacimonetes bacterium]|nr:T9SS type A sorting domain-containing protein [Candidatus Cloacimonadota bacterium]